MKSLSAARIVEMATSLVKERSSSRDPTEILWATLDLCRSTVSPGSGLHG